MFLGPEPLWNVNSKILHNSFKILRQQFFLHQHQKSERDLPHGIFCKISYIHKIRLKADLEDGFNALKHEDIEYSEDEKERKLGRKESEEPLAGVHVGFQSHRLEVLPQVRQVLLYQPVQLVEPHLQLLEILPVVKLFFRRPDMKTNIENTIEAALSVLTRFVSLRPT